MNPRRSATVAALCGTIVLAGWIAGWLAGFGSAGAENTHAVPIEDRAASLAANAEARRMNRRQLQWAMRCR